jgi:hypothetical protein
MNVASRLVCLALAFLGCCLPLVGSPAADRGIGGTGAPASGPVISDRGIGGTGIVGVVTGFGSVFVNGLEVAYSASTPLTVDGVAETDAALHVGQVATIVASDDHGLHAVSIDVRHEVSGPVTSVNAGGEATRLILVVAGQHVAVDSGTEGLQSSGRLQAVRAGDWVAVSGLREPDGVIAASRIDPRSPGVVLVRGTAMPEAGGWKIGDLGVQPPNGVSMASGTIFTARGTLADGRLAVTSADPDVLSANPGAYFGDRVQRMVIESYVSAADGHVRLGGGLLAAPGRGVAVQAGDHRVIVQLERGAHGDFVATHLRPIAPRRVPFGPERHGFFGPERHGFFGPPHSGPFRFGPPRFRPHAWEGHHTGFGHGGGWGRRPRMR